MEYNGSMISMASPLASKKNISSEKNRPAVPT
jgi:hypothetical protein